jgi:hypothetical protein
MEEITPKKFIIEYGLFTGIISVIFGIMLYSLDAHYENSTFSQIISVLIQLSGIAMAALAFKKANSGFISLSQTLKIGTGLSLILAIISLVWLYTLTNLLEPEFYDISLEIAYNKAIESNPEVMGGLDLKGYLEASEPFLWLAYPVIMVFTLFIGFIESLTIGLIIKKEDQ